MLLTSILGDAHAAEDCAQDTFVQGFQNWKRWRGEGSPEPWLSHIAMNVARSYWRKQRLRKVGELVRRLGRPSETAEMVDTALSADLTRALRSLPMDQAAAIVLRHLHGYSNREIAQALGVAESTVASRLAVAKAKLRDQLGDVVVNSGELGVLKSINTKGTNSE